MDQLGRSAEQTFYAFPRNTGDQEGVAAGYGFERGGPFQSRFGIERVDLVQRQKLPLGGQALVIGGEFMTDLAIGFGDILLLSVDQMDQHGASLHIRT